MLLTRQPLPGSLQARYDAITDTLFVDSRLPEPVVEQVIAEAHHELLGNHHLAPHVVRPRPALRVVQGERDTA